MKPAPFEYLRPATVPEAIAALATDEGAKLIAGGQSLVPLMAMRLARPTLLVDVNDLPLDDITMGDTGIRIGACARHRQLELAPLVARAVPLLHEAAGLIGYPAIRARGTIAGSLAHADPVAELPAVLVATSGSVIVRGIDGTREIAAADLFTGFLGTTLAPDEIIVEVRFPAIGPRHGSAFCEWAPRVGDFAVAGIGVALEAGADGRCVSIGAAACGISSVALDCSGFLAAVVGESAPTGALLEEIARAVRAGAAGDADRADLLGLLAARAVHRALTRSANVGAVAA